MKNALILVCLLAVAGCVTHRSRINEVSVGMTKPEVLAVMGKPWNQSAKDGVEYLHYQLSGREANWLYPTDRRFAETYTVRFVNGRVDAYGREDMFEEISVEHRTK